MAILKFKEIEKMNPQDRNKKLKELKLELVKSKANASKAGSAKTKEIRRIISRIKSLNSKNIDASKGNEIKSKEVSTTK